jgi:hypothetical protein
LRIHNLSSLLYRPVVEEITISKKEEFAAKMKKALDAEKLSALHGIGHDARSSQEGGHRPPRGKSQPQPNNSSPDNAQTKNQGGTGNTKPKEIDILI